jgi:HK97 family phage major capsid protein
VELDQEGNAVLELTSTEKRRYSIRNAINIDAARRAGDRRANSFELEISQEIEKHLGEIHSGYERKGGVLIPTGIALGQPQERAGLDTKTPTKGQELTFDEFGSFIDLLRPRSWVLALGATFLPGLKGDVGFPREETGGTVTWALENPGADVAAVDMTLGQVWLTPRTAQSTTSYSRQLLAQSTPAVDQVVAADIAKNHAGALDKAALQGTAPAPVGIMNQSIQTADFAATFNYIGAVQMEFMLLTANAGGNGSGLAYLADPTWARGYKTTPIGAAIGMPAWADGKVNGYRAEISQNMPAGSFLLADWPELLVGEWGMLEIITDPYAKKKQGMIEVTSFLLTDAELKHVKSFVKATNMGTIPLLALESETAKGKKIDHATDRDRQR